MVFLDGLWCYTNEEIGSTVLSHNASRTRAGATLMVERVVRCTINLCQQSIGPAGAEPRKWAFLRQDMRIRT